MEIVLLVFICGLLINAYMGRRGATAFSVLYLLSMWLIYVIHKGSNRFLVFIIGVLMLGVAYMIFIKTSDSFSHIYWNEEWMTIDLTEMKTL